MLFDIALNVPHSHPPIYHELYGLLEPLTTRTTRTTPVDFL